MTPIKKRADRFVDIDVAKGVAIFLVVTGHVVARDYRPQGNEWFLDFRESLYHFHMSFFFYLAGYVFFTAPAEQLGGRIRNAAERMVPAYLLVAVLAFVAKAGLARVVPVDRPIRSFWGDWIGLFLYPTSGFITFVWFIVALLVIYGLTVVAQRLMPHRFGLVLAIAAILHAASVAGWVTELFALQQVARYWVVFLLGRLALEHRDQWLPWMRAGWPVWIAALVLALAWSPPWLMSTLPALLSIPALHGMSAFVADHARGPANALAWLGAASWPIYLFNAFAIGATKAVILKTFGWDGARFLLALPLLVVAGLLLPVAAQRLVLARQPWLNRITR